VIPSLLLAILAASAGIAESAAAQGSSQAFTVDDLVRLKRLSNPQVSPDGRYVVYVLRETDMDANKGRTDLWLLDLAQKDAQPQRLTSDPANDTSPIGLLTAVRCTSSRRAAAARRCGISGSTEVRPHV